MKNIDKTLVRIILMETKSFTTRSMLQRAFTLTKQRNEQQLSSNLTVPILNKGWQRQSSTNSDVTITIPSPRLSTYALFPQRKFDFLRAKKHLQLELNRRCGNISKNIRYDPKLSIDLVRDLAQQLRRVIKPDYLNYIRYKIVIIISIVQTAPNRQTHQSMTVVSRCLWDRNTDGSITVQAKLGYDMLVIGTAFAVYTD
jgi:hypothetical protein